MVSPTRANPSKSPSAVDGGGTEARSGEEAVRDLLVVTLPVFDEDVADLVDERLIADDAVDELPLGALWMSAFTQDDDVVLVEETQHVLDRSGMAALEKADVGSRGAAVVVEKERGGEPPGLDILDASGAAARHQTGRTPGAGCLRGTPSACVRPRERLLRIFWGIERKTPTACSRYAHGAESTGRS